LNVPIHREGYPFIALFAGVNLLAFLIATRLGIVQLPQTIWCIAFFRDPERNTPTAPGLIVSPADGKLLPIVEAAPPPELGLGDAPRVRLSIFMNVFNVHVNRNPLSGTVIGLAYRPGKFFNASFDKASVHYERMAVRLRPDGGSANADLVVVQIAGLVARRIVCDLAQGELVQRGQRFGMIRFGSRLDVYLPPGARVVAAPGMKTVAGETVLAEMDAPQ
jgi:phosphatidylserine decarboxylase